MASKSHPAKLDVGFHNFQSDSLDWNAYITYRPKYPPSFFSRIYKRHSTRPSNTFQIAHDAGAGAGICAEKLAEKFTHVILSDPNQDYIQVASQRLSRVPRGDSNDKFAYYVEPAEKSSIADGSIDCFTICEAIHWTDAQATVAEAARQLKSGGTFCMEYYGPPRISGNQRAEQVWADLFFDSLAVLVADPRMHLVHRAVQCVRTGCDSLGFDRDVWEADVERCFTNCNGDRTAVMRCPSSVLAEEDQTARDELRTFVEADEDWMDEGCGLDWFRKVMNNYLIGVGFEDSQWEVLGDALEDTGGEVTVLWPGVQILATRK